MTTLLDLGQAQYVALETFKKNDQAVNTPVWIVRDGNRLLAITEGTSWKVKRIRNNPAIRLAKSDARGTPEGDFAEGQARILTDSAEITQQRKRLIKKYGLIARAFMLYSRLRGRQNNSVVIEITDSPAA